MNDPDTSSPNSVARAALTSTPIIDGHNDLAAALRVRNGYSVAGLDRVDRRFHTDIPRLVAGGVGGQFWSVYADAELLEPEAVVSTLEQIDAVYRLVAAYPDELEMAYTADDVTRLFAEGRIASLLGVEGGHSMANSLGVLRALARLGVRYMTLTHGRNLSWASSSTDATNDVGLDEDGVAIIGELNRLGIIADLSHTSVLTQEAALSVTRAPVIFSHSSASAVTDHPRNVNDEVLRLLAANDGVVQVAFVPVFVSQRVADWARELESVRDAAGLSSPANVWAPAPRPSQLLQQVRTIPTSPPSTPGIEAWLVANPRPPATIADVADHIEHIRDVAGIAHIGLGGDYDGVDLLPQGLEDVSGYPRLLDELVQRGWSQDDLEAVTGRNILRVLQACEDAATGPLWPATGARS